MNACDARTEDRPPTDSSGTCETSSELQASPDPPIGYIRRMPPLSPHLFWDVDRDSLDPATHGAWLTKRVLEHGRWDDWQALPSFYGKAELAELVTGLRTLEPRAFAFCRAWFDLPASSFRCSTSTNHSLLTRAVPVMQTA